MAARSAASSTMRGRALRMRSTASAIVAARPVASSQVATAAALRE